MPFGRDVSNGGGGGTIDSVARGQASAATNAANQAVTDAATALAAVTSLGTLPPDNTADIMALEASEAAQDALIAAAATDADLAAIEAKYDPAVETIETPIVRNADNSWTMTLRLISDGSQRTITTSPATGNSVGPDVVTATEQAAIDAAVLAETTRAEATESQLQIEIDSLSTGKADQADQLAQDNRLNSLETNSHAALTLHPDSIAGGATLTGQELKLPPAAATPATLDAVPTGASTQAVQSGGVFTALALKEDKANLVATVRSATTAEGDKYASELAIRTLVDGMVTGQTVTPFGATFATLPAIPPDASTTVRYRTILTADDIGTGTAESPQYPNGEYHNVGASPAGWVFAVGLGGDIIEGVLSDFDDATEMEIAKTWKAEDLDAMFQRHPEPLPANGLLKFGRNYYGTDGAYTLANWTSNIVDGVERNPRWVTLEQISSLNEDTKPSVTGKFKFSSTGQIFTGTLTASANFRWNLYWVDSDPDPANHAWLIHSNRELVLSINSLDDAGLLLTQTNHYTAYNGTVSDWVLRIPGGVPSGQVTFRYDRNSTGAIKLESNDGDVAPHRLNLNGLVNWTQTIGVEHTGKLITVEANSQTDRWNIYIEAGAEDNRNLREWEPGDGSSDVKYAAGDQVIVPMPINADWISGRNAEAGVNYVVKALNDRPNTVIEFNDVEADSGDWELIGAFRVSGSDFRTLTGTGTQALSFNDIGQTEAVSHTIPPGVTKSYLFSHSPAFITRFDDLIGTVTPTRVDAANQVTFDVAGPATMKMTRTGNATQFTFASNEKGSGGFSADMLDLATGDHGFTFDAANSDKTPTNTTKAIGGIGIRPVQANFTAAAQKQAWPITKDGDIAVYIPKHTVTPVTLQIGETATPSNLFGVDVALDGTLSQPVAQPTNQLSGITATKFDNDEWWKIVLSGTRPTEVTLKVWGNDIGDGTDFEDIRYAFTINSPFSADVTTQSFVRREGVAAAGGEWVDLGGGLEIRAGGDNNVVNYPRLRVSDGVDKRIVVDSWYHASATSEGTSHETRVERLAVGEEWNIRENTTYNLGVSYTTQEVIVKEPATGREWNIEYTVQADDASIVLNATYKAGDIFAVPAATVSKTQVTVMINGGANGTKQILEGAGAVSFILTNIPAGQVIDTATFEVSVLPVGVTALVRDESSGTLAVEVDDATGNVDITVPFMADPGQQDADAGWIIHDGGILECWGIATNGIVTLPNGLQYASNAYNLQATVNVGSNGDHTNNIHFTAKAFKISETQFRLKAQSQGGTVTGNTTWPMSWRTIGKRG